MEPLAWKGRLTAFTSRIILHFAMRYHASALFRSSFIMVLATCVLGGCRPSRHPFQGAYKVGRVSEGMRAMEFSADGR